MRKDFQTHLKEAADGDAVCTAVSRGSGTRRKRETQPILVARYFSLAAVVFALDQISKVWALGMMAPGDSIPVISGFFHLTLVHNTGVAFGLFRNGQALLFLIISGSLAVLLVLAFRMFREESGVSRTNRIALALILGGAAGNWIDRIRYHAVIDFLDFRVWPVFNLADSAITIGVLFFAWALIRKKS